MENRDNNSMIKISVHRVGNKINGESLIISEFPLEIDQEMKNLLSNFFLGHFKSEMQYCFYHDSYLSLNQVYSSCVEIFENKDSFHRESENIATHLYEAAENPRVQGGELFIVYFEGEDTDAGKIDSIGIFKTERRENFLKIFPKNEAFELEKDQGINLSKIDKAALIYNNDKENGYVI